MLNQGVYFILASEVNRVKIGFSDNIRGRLSGIQSGSPCKLYLIGVAEGSKLLEQVLHEKFEPFRFHGEWFKYSDSIQDFLMQYVEMNMLTREDALFLKHMRDRSIDDFYEALKGFIERTGVEEGEIMRQYSNFSQELSTSCPQSES